MLFQSQRTIERARLGIGTKVQPIWVRIHDSSEDVTEECQAEYDPENEHGHEYIGYFRHTYEPDVFIDAGGCYGGELTTLMGVSVSDGTYINGPDVPPKVKEAIEQLQNEAVN